MDSPEVEEKSKTSQSVVEKLVERFNLNKDEVTGVFDEMRQEREQQRQTYMEARLDEAVEDGVITADQREAFLKKQPEWQEKERQSEKKVSLKNQQGKSSFIP